MPIRTSKMPLEKQTSTLTTSELIELLSPVFRDIAAGTEVHREYAETLRRLSESMMNRDEVRVFAAAMHDETINVLATLKSVSEKLYDQSTKHDQVLNRMQDALDRLGASVQKFTESNDDEREHLQELEKLQLAHKQKVRWLLWSAVAGGGGVLFLVLEKVFHWIGV